MLQLMVDPRGLVLDRYDSDDSGAERFDGFLHYCLEFDATYADHGGALVGLESPFYELEPPQPRNVDSKFNSKRFQGKDLISQWNKLRDLIEKNALDKFSSNDKLEIYFNKANINGMANDHSNRNQEDSIDNHLKTLVLAAWILDKEEAVALGDQFLVSPLVHSQPEQQIQVQGYSVSYNYKGKVANKKTDRSLAFIESTLSAYGTLRSLVENNSKKLALTPKQEFEESLHSKVTIDNPRSHKFQPEFWPTVEKLKIFEHKVNRNKLLVALSDELNRRDHDGSEIHHIGKKGPSSPILEWRGWKAWQRDLDKGSLRVQLWRRGDEVSFARVEEAHENYDVPKPEE